MGNMRFKPQLAGCFSCQIASPVLTAIAAVIVLSFTAQPAYAHHPIVQSATATCVDNAPFISYTVVSWDPGSTIVPKDGDNPVVEVLFNGVVVPKATSGFFPNTTPPDQFSGMQPAPLATNTVIVSALAVGIWGDGYPGGENSNDYGASITVTIPQNCAPGIGRFTGGGKDVVTNAIVPAGSVTLTKGFEVECDMNPTHENLELNWTGGNHFHMDLITSAICTLQGPPNPPTAPVNRIDGTGTGSYNGIDGYTVVFTLIDNGEPGTNDAAGFMVCQTDKANPNSCATSANVVLSVPLQTVTTGNIQAHVDQQ